MNSELILLIFKRKDYTLRPSRPCGTGHYAGIWKMYILTTWKNGRSVYRIGKSKLSTKNRTHPNPEKSYEHDTLSSMKEIFGKSPIFYSVNEAKIYARAIEDTEPVFLNFRDFIFPEG